METQGTKNRVTGRGVGENMQYGRRAKDRKTFHCTAFPIFLVFEPCECITYLKNKGDLKSLMTLHTSEDAKSLQFLVV